MERRMATAFARWKRHKTKARQKLKEYVCLQKLEASPAKDRRRSFGPSGHAFMMHARTPAHGKPPDSTLNERLRAYASNRHTRLLLEFNSSLRLELFTQIVETGAGGD
jgi:hypothetical protein